MKFIKIISNITSYFLFFTILFLVFINISSKASGGEPSLFGYQLKTVLSGSMEPTFQTGSIIAVKPGGEMNRFKAGDIIVFTNQENQLITHRILEVKGSGEQLHYITKGDNNNGPDRMPVFPQSIQAEYKDFTIPYIGYFLNFASSKAGTLFLIIPGLLLFTYSVFSVWRTISAIEMNTTKATK